VIQQDWRLKTKLVHGRASFTESALACQQTEGFIYVIFVITDRSKTTPTDGGLNQQKLTVSTPWKIPICVGKGAKGPRNEM